MSFRFLIIFTISVLIALVFGIGGTVLITASFNNSLESEISSALDSYNNVRNTLSLLNSLTEQNDYSALSDALSQMNERGMGNWQAISLKSSEETVYESGANRLGGYSFELPESGKCAYTEISDEYGNGIAVISVISVGEEELSLTARFDISAVYSARETYQRLFRYIYIVVVLLGIIVAIAIAFAMTRKLHKLTSAVRKIAGGDLECRSGLNSRDEFGQLSRDIDVMADKLQDNISRLESEMQRQEAFMCAFAHELKTPMTSIIGYADLLRQDGLEDDTRLTAANYVFSEGQRLEKLSFKLLDMLLLKKDSVIMRQVSMNAFLQEIDQALSPILEDKDIRLVCVGERGRAAFEPDLVKSLLYNLIDNASKAIDGKGIIVVKGNIIRGGCEFRVADNGRGMESAELTKITEAFYRVDKSRSRKQGGAGLGLALCKQIAELHRGSIKFSSEVGKGTTVTVTLYGRENKNVQA